MEPLKPSQRLQFNRHRPEQDRKESVGRGHFFQAAKHNHIGVLTKILEEFPIAAQWEQNGKTALLTAAAQGNFLAVQLLLKHGAAPNGRSRENLPLHEAAAQGRVDIAALLLHHGASPDASRNSGVTPLMEAVRCGKRETAELLLGRGASLKAFDDDGNAPLHIAVAGNNAELVQLLLNRGADINLRNRDTLTPLMLAAEAGSLTAARALLEAGADFRLENDLRETAAALAAARGEQGDRDFSRDFAGLVRQRQKREAAKLATPFHDGNAKEFEAKKPLRFKLKHTCPKSGPK